MSAAATPAALRSVSDGALSLTVVDDESGFDRLKDDWDALAARMTPSSPMLSWDWARTWWRYFHQGARLQIVVFKRDGAVLGIAPFQKRVVGIRSLGLAVMKPLGWEDYGQQGMTEHIELLFPPKDRRELMSGLARWFADSPVATAWLPSIPHDEALPGWIDSHVVRTQPWVPFHHRALPSDWLAFVQGLNKSMRSNSRYYAKLLIRHGHTFELEVAETPDEVARLFPEVVRLHRIRAQAADVSRVSHHDHFYRQDRVAFLREILSRLAADHEFKIGILHVDGDVVASQMWFERDARVFLYYSGFEPEWAKYGVQLVTTLEVLKHAMRNGITHVEFLRGGGQLKERWDTDVRLVRNIQVARSVAFADGLHLADRARHRVRRLVAW